MILAPLLSAWVAAVIACMLDGRRRGVVWAAVGALGSSTAFAARLAHAVARRGELATTIGGWPEALGITLSADVLGVSFLLVADIVLLASLLYHAIAGEPSRWLPGLVLFMTAGLTGLFLTADAFNFFVFFEVSMASAFAMCAHGRDPAEVTAAVLFVTLNLIGSTLFLLAIGGLYRSTGALSFAEIGSALSGAGAPLATGVGALLLAAFTLKLGLFPFHIWVPQVYRDLRPEVAAIFAGALANIGSYGLLRFGAQLMPATLSEASPLLLVMGAVSILYGGVAAVGAEGPRAILAYSSIGQVGYVLIGLGLGGSAGLAAALAYALVNAGNKCILFLASGMHGTAAAGIFLAGAFSLAGVPPFVGFAAKAAIFRGAIAAGAWVLLGVLVAGSALTFIYVFKALKPEWWGPGVGRAASPASAVVIGVALAALLAGLGAWPQPLLQASAVTSAALLAEEP